MSLVRAERTIRPYLILLLLLLSFALRLHRLDVYDISGDEAWSVTVAGWPISEIVSSDAETNPPLYHLVLHGMMRLGGSSTFVIRYASVLFSVLAVAYISRLGRAAGGWSLGHLALTVASASPFLIYYAQDARMYGPALMGSAGSTATFVMITRAQRQNRGSSPMLWLHYITTSLISVFSHYYAFAVLMAQAAYVGLSSLSSGYWSAAKRWILSWLLLALLFLPWPLRHAQYLNVKASSRFEEWTLEKLVEISRRTFIAYGAGITLPGTDAWHGWAICALAALGLAFLLIRSELRHLGYYSAVTLFTAVFFAWSVNPIMPFFYERYLLVGIPLFLMLLASGIWALFRLWKPATLLGIALLFFVSAASLRNQFYNAAYDKGGYGRMLAEIEANAAGGDLMLLNNPLQASLFDYYYFGTMPFERIDRGKIFTEQNTDALLSELTEGYQRIWLVETGNPESYDPRHRVQRWLGQKGSRALYENYGNGNILHLFYLTASGDQRSYPVTAYVNEEIMLTGYKVAPEPLRQGDTLLLTLYWQAIAPIERGYTVFTHLVDAGGQLVAQTDGQPVGGARPTNSWQSNEVVEDKYALLLPDELAAGEYTLRVGMYLWPELTRLPAQSEENVIIDDAIVLGTVELLSPTN